MTLRINQRATTLRHVGQATLLCCVLLLAACSGQDEPAAVPSATPVAVINGTPSAGDDIPGMPANRGTQQPALTPPSPAGTAAATDARAAQASPAPSGPVATPTPSPSVTPSPTATRQPTATPSPTATEPASQLFSDGQRYEQEGNYAAARRAYAQVVAQDPEGPRAGDAAFHLAESYLADGYYTEALEAFLRYLDAAPDHGRGADAQFHVAEAYAGLGQWEQALAAYQTYLKIGSPLLTYDVQLRLANVYASLQRPADMVAAYAAAVDAAPDLVRALRAREQWAAAASTRGDYAAALAQYQAIIKVSQNAAYRAEMNALAGDAAWNLGNPAQAETYWRAAVALAPSSSYAYQALIQLVNQNYAVDSYVRGLVDYENQAYTPAINAFSAFLAAAPGERRGAALAYIARSYQGLQNYDMALATWDRLISELPGDAAWANAWLGKAETYRFAGNRPAAISTLQTFVDRYPDHALVPDVRYELARQLEREARYDEAAQQQILLVQGAPQVSHAAEALLRGGINRYRSGDVAAALNAWQDAVKAYPKSGDLDTIYLWLGKGYLAQQQRALATEAWQTLVTRWPDGYAAARARVLAASAGLELATTAPAADGATALPADDGSQAYVERWLRSWSGASADVSDLARLDPKVLADKDWQRANLYLGLRLRGPALETFETVRSRYWNDPLVLYQLALAFRDLGVYRLSIISAARVIALAPASRVVDAPLYLQRLSYPRYYDDLVSAEAAAFGVDPLLVDAVIRQESLFEAGAESYAAARGLMQVIPTTGQWIAGELGMADYRTADLYRPWISIKFGTFYIMRGLRAADGNVATALVGYNAGPANARFWRERSGEDEDLFYETVSLDQPRAYLSLITTHYAHYARLYGGDQNLLDAQMDRSRWDERPVQ